MSNERVQPLPVRSPTQQPLRFALRCLVDLQLATIARPLRPALQRLRGRVLDVGAGTAPWRGWIPSECQYQGLDVAYADAFAMGERGANADIVYYDGVTIPFGEGAFDSAICIEVLEHVRDPDALLTEIARVLKPDSPLVLTVPWSARCHHRPHDYHRFTSEQLGLMLGRHGFDILALSERGDDIAAVANKMAVITFALLSPVPSPAYLFRLVVGVALLPMSVAWLLAAHISVRLNLGSKDDPLGYFVLARRRNLSQATTPPVEP